MIQGSRFSRTVINESKMGAYYTDLTHCADLSALFSFQEEACCLEPSIGDGSAIMAVTDKANNPYAKIFGVELDESVAKKTRADENITACLVADFTTGVRISNNKFSFCFANPPYMTDKMDGNKRMERVFLEKVGYYLCKGGILVWVIPYSVYTEENYFRFLNSRYEVLHLWKFREPEFSKWHQCVIVARKRNLQKAFLKADLQELLSKVTPLEKVEELPAKELLENYEKIIVPGTKEADVSLFAESTFDVESAYTLLESKPREVFDGISKALTVKQYAVNSIGNPPIPLKKDSLYLLATSGAGQGLTGSVEAHDLHLQRGVAEVIEEGEVEQTESGDSAKKVAKVTTRTSITMTVVQNDGTITVLE